MNPAPQAFNPQMQNMQNMQNRPPMQNMQNRPPMQMQTGGPQQFMPGQYSFGGQQAMGGQRTVIDEQSSSTTSEEYYPSYERQQAFREPIMRPAYGSPQAGPRASYAPLNVSRTVISPPPVRIVGRPMSPYLAGGGGRGEVLRSSYTSYYDNLRQPTYTSGLYTSGYQEDYRRSLATPVVVGSVIRPELRQVGVIRSDVVHQSAPPPPPPRTLLIRPVAARLTHNTHFFLKKMNPFVEVLVGPHRYKTAVMKRGGKRPQWNETFTHPLIGNDMELTVIVWDQHRRRVALVGETRINLSEVLAHGKSSNWYELFFKGKPAGRVLLNLEIA